MWHTFWVSQGYSAGQFEGSCLKQKHRWDFPVNRKGEIWQGNQKNRMQEGLAQGEEASEDVIVTVK